AEDPVVVLDALDRERRGRADPLNVIHLAATEQVEVAFREDAYARDGHVGLREVFASSWLRGSIWERGTGESRVGWRAGRILFEIEYASGHAFALARSEIGRGEGDVDRREQAAERPRRHRLLHPLVAFAFLFTLHAPLALGQRPPDVDLIDADPIAIQQRRGVARERHQAAF